MPQFTQWNVPSPFPNVLFNPAAVDKSIAELGHLGVERERLDLDRDQLAKDQAFTDRLIEAAKNAAGTETGTAPAGGGGGTYAPGTPFTPKMLPPGVSLDEDAMVRTIAGEAAGQPLTGQIAVAHVIANRAKGANVSPRDVVFAPNQFEPWNGGAARARLEAMQPFDPAYQAILNNVVRPALSGKAPDPTGGATHFYAPVAQRQLGREPPSWGRGTPSAVIGGHNFYSLGYGPGQARSASAPASAPSTAVETAAAPPPFNPNAGPRVGSVPPAAPAIVPPTPVGTNPNAQVQIPPATTAQIIPPPVRAAAQALLAMPEAEAAIAYGPTVRSLQAQGLAMNAPPTYPGHAALQAIVSGGSGGARRRSVPAGDAVRRDGSRRRRRWANSHEPDVILDASGNPLLPPPPAPAPNRMAYGTGLPGVTIGLPTNGLAPPPAAAPPSPGTASGGAATRAPVLQQPAPAPSRVIPMDPQIQSGLFAGLTRKQAMSVAEMSAGGAKPAAVMLHIDQLRQHNDVLRQQNATNAAAEADANYRREQDFRKAQDEAAKDVQDRADKAEAQRIAAANNAREAAKAHEQILDELAPKMEEGSPTPATPAEKRRYAGSYYALQQAGATATTMDDPNNPGQKIPAMITRRLPKHFPEPDGGALPLVMSSPGAPTAAPLTVEQGKAAGYADRLQQALPIIADTSPAAMSRWEQMLGKTPLLANSLISPEFQLHLQAERNFINAVLRQESGASIQPEEFASARQQYIPQPGDSPQVLAEKKRNRETKLAEMIREAGAGYKPATTTAPGGSSSTPAMKPPPPGSKVIIP